MSTITDAPVAEEAAGQHEPDAAADAFAERVMTAGLGWFELMSIHLGSQLGWYAELDRSEGLTPAELAGATSTSARYAREWLEHQTVSGIVLVDDPDRVDRRYRLAPGVSTVLLDTSSLSYLEPLARFAAAVAGATDRIIDAYRTDGGVSWDELGRHAREAQADMNRPWFDGMPALLADLPHVEAALSAPGARVADVGCGAGWSAIALAQRHPRLQVIGVDVDAPSIELARANAEAQGVADRVAFIEADAAQLAGLGPFDAVFAFECIHDMPDPVAVLGAMREAAKDGAPAIVMDEATAERFTPDAGELEQLLYGLSLFVCLPDGKSTRPSVETGTVMRPATLRTYARSAGWSDVRTVIPEFGLWRFYELT